MADTSLIVVGATACTLSAVFGWVAFKAQREHREWCGRGLKADGVVSGLGERRGHGLPEDAAGMESDPTVMLVPVVRFRAANGMYYEVDAPEAPAEIGSKVEIAYEPTVPSGGRAVARKPKIGVPVVLFVMGAILVLVGISR